MKRFLSPLCLFLVFSVYAMKEEMSSIPSLKFLALAAVSSLSIDKRDEQIAKLPFELRNEVDTISKKAQDVRNKFFAKSITCLENLTSDTPSELNIAWHPDGNILASCSHAKTIKLWDLKTKTVINTLKGHTDWVLSIACHPNGNTFASCSHDKTIKLWDLETQTIINTLKSHTHGVLSIAWHPDGKILASCSNDNTIKLWDLKTKTVINTLKGHTTWVRNIAWHPNGRTLASCSDDRNLKLWGTSTDIAFLIEKLTALECVALLNKEKKTETYRIIPEKIRKIWEKSE